MKYELEEVERGIATVIREIESRNLWNNPEALSNNLVRLAAYLNHYATHMGEMKMKFELDRQKKYVSYREAGSSQNQSEIEAKNDTLHQRTEFEAMDLKYKAWRDFVSAIQTHLATQRAFKEIGNG